MRILVLAAIAGCAGPPVPPPISATAPARTGESCALATPRRSPVQLRYEKWLGRIGDRSWLIAERARAHVLVALGDDGALVITPLPGSSRDQIATTVVDTHLWLDLDPPGPGQHETVFDIDLSTSHPAITRAEALSAKTLAGTNSFGISAVRMLAYSFTASAPGPGFQLWDRERHVPIATVPYTSYASDGPTIRCVRDHCFAVTRPDSAGRSFSSRAFAPDGTSTTEPITSDDRIRDYLVIPDGEHTLVVWNGFARDRLFARLLDASGHPIGRELSLLTAAVKDVQLVPGPQHAVAFHDEQGWVVAKLARSADALEPAQRIGLPKAEFLTIAQGSDGVLAIAFTTDVPIDTVVPATTASAVFVPNGRPPTAPIDVLFGERRIGWAPFPLVAPARAAALVLDQTGDPAGELVILREPCGRAGLYDRD